VGLTVLISKNILSAFSYLVALVRFMRLLKIIKRSRGRMFSRAGHGDKSPKSGHLTSLQNI